MTVDVCVCVLGWGGGGELGRVCGIVCVTMPTCRCINIILC